MNKFNVGILFIVVFLIGVYTVNAVASLSHNVGTTTNQNVVIINITNNITNYVTSWNNITNTINITTNITQIFNTSYFINQTNMIFIENNFTNNITNNINNTIYAGEFYNITNNITQYNNITNNITQNISNIFNFYYYMVSWSKYILSNGTTPYIDFNESELNTTIKNVYNNTVSYCEIYNTNITTTTLITQNVYYNLSNFTKGYCVNNNVEYYTNKTIIRVLVNGTYEVSYSLSTSLNIANTVNYRLLINEIEEPKSYSYMTYTQNNRITVATRFLLYLNYNDTISLQTSNLDINNKILTSYNNNIIIRKISV